MHEMSIAQEILRLIQQTAHDAKAERVKKIWLKVGAFSGIMIDSLQFGLEILAKDTLADSATINIEPIPLVVKCPSCQKEFHIEPTNFICPQCENIELEIISGEELELVSVDVDMPF